MSPLRPFPIAPTMPLEVGVIHLIGIGGIGMSGIAELLHNLGYQVQGSDQSKNANVQRLRKLGMVVHIGHQAEHVQEAAVVVKSTAVKWDNPEILEARKRGIPVVRRSEMLVELTKLKNTIAIAGSHGKTTTTSMVATLLDHAGLEPTILNGGILNSIGTNAKLGKGPWMVVEADESDGTFIKIPSTVAVVTNIDPEHMDYWENFDKLKQAFVQFIENLPFYGFAVLCTDHPEVQKLLPDVIDRRIITYGVNPQADVRAMNIEAALGGTSFTVRMQSRTEEEPTVWDKVFLPVPGEHNVINALSAIAIGHELGISERNIRDALASFVGVKRRFTRTGEVEGVTVVDDYGHHPVEIAATLKAARQFAERSNGRVIAVMQPHRYSRLSSLFADFSRCFNEADQVMITPVYEAGEAPLEGINRDTLVEAILQSGHKAAQPVDKVEDVADWVHTNGQRGDIVICLGAGNITQWAASLPELLEAKKLQCVG